MRVMELDGALLYKFFKEESLYRKELDFDYL